MTTSPPTLIRDPWRRVWRFLTGDRFLAIVITVVAVLLTLSTRLPQTPHNDPVAYSRWLSETQQRFGSFTAPLITLGLFSITDSFLFRFALALLGLCCTLRLMDCIEQLRAIDRVPEQPTRPMVDRLIEVDLATAQSRLKGYRIRSHADGIVADRWVRPALIAALLSYGGTLVILIGLVLGAFVDFRVDNLALEPNSVTAIPDTPYSIRLDAIDNGRASMALLNQTEVASRGQAAYQEPFIGSGLSIYLDSIGPALVVSATRTVSGTLNLQITADDPLQPEKLLAFTADRQEGFVAAPDAGIVLRIGIVNPDQYNVQAYQSASGNILTSGVIAPGSTLVVSQTTFVFQPSAFMTVSAVNQPSHWVILPAWIITLLGLFGVMARPARRVWLQAVDSRTRVVSDDPTFDPTQPVAAATRRLALNWLLWPIWIAWTAVLFAILISIYLRSASLAQSSSINAALGAWLILSSSAIVKRRNLRLSLIVVGLVLGLVAISLII